MLWLQLGERTTRPAEHGAREVGEYALHVSCPWRLVGPEGIYVAAGDLFTPADPSADVEGFDWQTPGATWLDARLRTFIESTSAAQRAVSAVSADDIGSLRLLLGDDFVLDLFPDSSHTEHIESEFWRLLQPMAGAPHFVVGSFGLDRVTEA
jgi:hypothetical protein